MVPGGHRNVQELARKSYIQKIGRCQEANLSLPGIEAS